MASEQPEVEGARIDLGPLDVVSFPPGVARRFMNVTHDEPGKEHILLFVIAGDAPGVEFTPGAVKRMDQFNAEA